MNRRNTLHFVAAALATALVLDACPRPAASLPAESPNPAEQRLEEATRANMEGAFRFRPAWATTWGVHEYDSLLGDRLREAIDGEVRRLRATLPELGGIAGKRR